MPLGQEVTLHCCASPLGATVPTWCSAMSPACCRTALRATSKLSTTSAAGAPSARGKCCEYGDTKGLGGLPFPEGRGKQGRLRAAAVGKHLQNSLLPPKCCAGAGWAVGLCAHPWAGMLCCESAMLPRPPLPLLGVEAPGKQGWKELPGEPGVGKLPACWWPCFRPLVVAVTAASCSAAGPGTCGQKEGRTTTWQLTERGTV